MMSCTYVYVWKLLLFWGLSSCFIFCICSFVYLVFERFDFYEGSTHKSFENFKCQNFIGMIWNFKFDFMNPEMFDLALILEIWDVCEFKVSWI